THNEHVYDSSRRGGPHVDPRPVGSAAGDDARDLVDRTKIRRRMASVDPGQNTFGIDHEEAPSVEAEHPENPVGPGDLLVFVGEEGKCETALLLGETVMALQALRTDGENVGVEGGEPGHVLGVGVELSGADRRVVTRIEDQHDGAAPVFVEAVGAVLAMKGAGKF